MTFQKCIFSCIILLSIADLSFPQICLKDSLAMQAILDTNGYPNVDVHSQISVFNGRIYSINFGRLPASEILPYIDCLPSQIGDLDSLKYLEVFWQPLSYVSDSIGKLKSLKRIDFHANLLRNIPQGIKHLPSLQYLDISSNLISSIDDNTFYELINLLSLNLSLNQFSILPASIGNCKKLNDIYLNSCNLYSLPDELASLNIYNIDIGYNHICHPSPAIRQWLDSILVPEWDIIQDCTEAAHYSPTISRLSKDFGPRSAISIQPATHYSISNPNSGLKRYDAAGRVVKSAVVRRR
jgi:hypothetical protein